MNHQSRFDPLSAIGIILIGGLAFFFLNVRYANGVLSLLFSAVFVAALFFAGHNSLSSFMVVFLSGVFVFISLCITFGRLYDGNSPLSIPLALGPYCIFCITAAVTGFCWFWHERTTHKDKFPLILLCLYILLWVILGINVRYFDDWKMENYLTVPFVLLLLLTFRQFRLSHISYTLIFIYMTLHIIGTHYTYSEVPFGFWMKDVLHLSRNHYDRIIHFLFGLLLAYPVREIAVRIGNFAGFWGLYVPVEFILAFSAIYELIEYAIAVFCGGDLGVAYLGTQGDVWDAQKDMLIAFSGSIIAMTVTGLLMWYYNKRHFLKTLKESLQVKSDVALGEQAIEEYKKK